MRSLIVLVATLAVGEGATTEARRPVVDPLRFPVPGTNVLPVGNTLYTLTKYLDLGSSTRVYLAAISDLKKFPDDQTYIPPSEGGRSLPGPLPSLIVIKCLSTTTPKLLNSIENEFQIYSELNRHNNVRKPVGLYLSPRWTCPDGLQQCQYIAMTYINSDLDRLVSRGYLRLKPPIVIGAESDNDCGVFSFEIFLLSLGIGLVDALTQLHTAGFAHGDVRACNIALELPGDDHVVLLDVGAGTRLAGLPEVEQERLTNHDFGQIHRLLTKMLAVRIDRIYRAPKVSVLDHFFRQLAGKSKDDMTQAFVIELSRHLNVTATGYQVIYKETR